MRYTIYDVRTNQPILINVSYWEAKKIINRYDIDGIVKSREVANGYRIYKADFVKSMEEYKELKTKWDSVTRPFRELRGSTNG